LYLIFIEGLFFKNNQQPIKYKLMYALDSLSGSKLVYYASTMIPSKQQEAKHVIRFVEFEVSCNNSKEEKYIV